MAGNLKLVPNSYADGRRKPAFVYPGSHTGMSNADRTAKALVERVLAMNGTD